MRNISWMTFRHSNVKEINENTLNLNGELRRPNTKGICKYIWNRWNPKSSQIKSLATNNAQKRQDVYRLVGGEWIFFIIIKNIVSHSMSLERYSLHNLDKEFSTLYQYIRYQINSTQYQISLNEKIIYFLKLKYFEKQLQYLRFYLFIFQVTHFKSSTVRIKARITPYMQVDAVRVVGKRQRLNPRLTMT